MLKRAFDIVFSFLGLLFLSPVFLILSLLIVCDSRGGVFFRGVRVGQYGKPFRIFKFRSMIKDAEGAGKWNVGNNDSRLTRVGRFLRTTKLDEIPQLINVLLGEMSFVGPRPELQYYVDMYTEEEKLILQRKPGITDWASIVNSGQFMDFTNAEDPDKTYLEEIRPVKLMLQMYYAANNGFFTDIKIIFITIFKVLTRSAYIPAEIRSVTGEVKSGQGLKAS